MVPKSCPDVVTKAEAIADKKLEQETGLMYCFCQTVDDDAIDFSDVSPGDTTKYCDESFANMIYLSFMKQVTSFSVLALNIGACFIFEQLAPLSRFYTKNEETESIMKKILAMQFLNIAFVPIIVQFSLNAGFLNDVGLLQGSFEDFSVPWYRQVGATLCFTMLVQSISPHLSKIGMALFWEAVRFWDRGFHL